VALMTWSDSLSVGVEEIDFQNLGLVNTLNAVHEVMMSGYGRDVTGPMLMALVKYTHDHFAEEEEFMLKTRYPKLAEQRAHHHHLTREVEHFVERYQSGDIEISAELVDFLRQWLRNHIQKEDKLNEPWGNERSGCAKKIA
jgi:hemerythrin